MRVVLNRWAPVHTSSGLGPYVEPLQLALKLQLERGDEVTAFPGRLAEQELPGCAQEQRHILHRVVPGSEHYHGCRRWQPEAAAQPGSGPRTGGTEAFTIRAVGYDVEQVAGDTRCRVRVAGGLGAADDGDDATGGDSCLQVVQSQTLVLRIRPMQAHDNRAPGQAWGSDEA